MDKQQAKQKIKELVEKYETVVKEGNLNKYTEEDTKKGFIQPLFEALGWNFHDRKEVSAEESRSDYGFYINERPKFYLEAKALRVDLMREDFANQAIRYSWNKGVTWAVLTDFENIIVFNAQDISKNWEQKRFLTLRYNEYIEHFDKLWLLSKESFQNDLLDKEAEPLGKKLQKIPISALLSDDLNKCRNILIDGLSQCNRGVDKNLLEEGVQKLLDRLIFIRVAEDREIEPKILLPLIRSNKADEEIYNALVKKFCELNEFYDSDLFAPHPLEKWEEYSGAVKKVINILHGKKGYYEYDFKAMPADVLGAVYENYLGYRLLQSKKGATLDKDAKKRKEQGIYYTPTFIVDYIVKNALKPVLDKCQSVYDLKKIRVLDPACGSGSFLIKALEVIYDKYYEFSNRSPAETKRTILLENIYGVDLDEQAVEIARLNLLLSALDEKRKLPVLSQNIKNGNSLISGTDEELKKYFGKNFRDKKPFNWEEEFPEVFKQGGFDVVIGNPPYVRVDSLDEIDKDFWKKSFMAAEGKYDLYYLFIEQSLKLLKEGGNFGFIVPNKFCVADSGKQLRNLIFDKTKTREFFSVSQIDVFKDAANYPVILFFQKGKSFGKTFLTFAKEENEVSKHNLNRILVRDEDLEIFSGHIIPVNIDKRQLELVLKLSKTNSKFEDYLKISEGLRIPEKLESNQKTDFKIVKQYQFSRYSDVRQGSFIKLDDLKTVVNFNTERFKNSQKDKILIAEDALFISATLDKDKYIPQGGVYFATLLGNKISLIILLGLLNSKLLSFIYKILFGGMHMGGGYLRYRTNFLYTLPVIIKDNNFELDSLVDKILKLNKQLDKIAENSNKWNALKSEIEKTDRKIDEEVYNLYGLTPEEIKTVESL
ncbi:MAG: hypothetical protein A3G49_00300 [Candidatus Sungbacteria bacterium RIFCSPLOWO2_12_FULL_41_11]|uniref:site-specific DNA-methyltransferase (adenine-specific) n=1 Tax=Candidatus Sungbacteria bacterium RIFCSPLOWO2_12_FULL_41_11 TaxID=1802286 RepID=A0A1G2LPF8_9BACT|nr:MAG: hypothetical protein UV01_C0011G0070 [Parcubacteria group bacterium GW2011_GWA2_42_14]OGZ98423.1 MAG: hypothetical protein A3D41_01615 [Candidatus Sungbacteria bacterium RIFCSPHIGHO2_02_FULL_41_12b]OHA13518.1 MAG: hypothetical protein A3G49_00300 [Candidatus Sungbacteria bacterium RIFCSPLOWO2_12_FULL_41_11]